MSYQEIHIHCNYKGNYIKSGTRKHDSPPRPFTKYQYDFQFPETYDIDMSQQKHSSIMENL